MFFQAPVAPQSTVVETFKFGPSIDHYQDFVRFLAAESGETSPDDVVLFSKVYPGVVRDVRSFCQWQAWTAGRDPEDRVLWGSTRLVFSANRVRALLLIHGHGTHDLLLAVRHPPSSLINYIRHLVHLRFVLYFPSMSHCLSASLTPTSDSFQV